MATIPTSIFISYLALVCSIILTCEGEPNPTIDGFTTDLIHRDSPDSPLYDPSATDLQRHTDNFVRSINRAKFFNTTIFGGKSADADLTVSKEGVYLMRYSLGTPPEVQIGIIDTGSFVTWTQCKPCNRCIRQKLEIFNPRLSKTYKPVRCKSAACEALSPDSTCDAREEKCRYISRYEDGSTSNGPVATDTFTFYSERKGVFRFDNIIFGCGQDNHFTSVNGSASGLVGLAGGKTSLPMQLGYDKFAYCLMLPSRRQAISKIHFGEDAVVAGRGVTTTPLGIILDHYFLTMKGVLVGNQFIQYHTTLKVAAGNMLIDSGSVLTLFPENFYNRFEAAVTSQIDETPVRDFGEYKLCYENPFEMPPITVYMEGAAVGWSILNTFMRVTENIICMTVVPTRHIPIYGNVAQSEFLIGYDLGKHTLSFKRTQCGD